MVPTSVSATLAPTAPPPPPAATRSTPRRAPFSAAPLAAASSALLAVTPAAHAVSFSKEDVTGSLTTVVDTVDTAIGVGGQVAGQSVAVLRALGEAVKPALPVLQSAGEQALKLASPLVSDVSKQATEALQGAGVDPAPPPVRSKDTRRCGPAGHRRREADRLRDRGDHRVSGRCGLRGGRRSRVPHVPAPAAGMVTSLVQSARLQRRPEPSASSGHGHLSRLPPHRRAKREGQGQRRRAAAPLQREEQAHLSAAGRASEQDKGHGAQREASRGRDRCPEDLLPQEGRQGIQHRRHGLVQRQFEDRGENTEQRRVQELLGHVRRLLRTERVGAEPPRNGVLQPLRGRSREAVAGDSGSRRSVRDDFVDFDSLPDYSQASSWQCGRLTRE